MRFVREAKAALRLWGGNQIGKRSRPPFRSIISRRTCSQTTEVAMTLLIMFLGFMAAVAAMTYIEVRRIRKKLNTK
jgi:hypothetical protein